MSRHPHEFGTFANEEVPKFSPAAVLHTGRVERARAGRSATPAFQYDLPHGMQGKATGLPPERSIAKGPSSQEVAAAVEVLRKAQIARGFKDAANASIPQLDGEDGQTEPASPPKQQVPPFPSSPAQQQVCTML